MEHMFDDGTFTPYVDDCVEAVLQSDIYIIILGNKVGSFPPNETRTYTEIELDNALQSNKYLFCLRFDEFDESKIDNKEKHNELLNKFKGRPIHHFASSLELRNKLYEFLFQFASKTRIQSSNPYKGLAAFNVDDGKYFFGRDIELQSCIKKFITLSGQKILAVIGNSGTGKSSFVQAGLLYQLNTNTDLKFSDYKQVVVIPGNEPYTNLKYQLHINDIPWNEVESNNSTTHKLIIYFDQFEEVITQCQTDQSLKEREQLLEWLNSTIVADANSNIKVICSFRSDFLSQLANFNLIKDHSILFPLNSLDYKVHADNWEQSMLEIITKPAKVNGVQIEAELVNKMIEEIKEVEGSLSILQFTLLQIWTDDTIADGFISSTEYNKLTQGKGIAGIIETHAEQVINNISSNGSDTSKESIIKSLMVNLVEVNANQHDVKRTVNKDDLLEILNVYPSEDVNAVFEMLVSEKSRLLNIYQDKDETTTVGIIHEELIRKWNRLRGWINERRNALQFQKRILMDIEAYKAKDESLYGKEQLKRSVDWQKNNPDLTNEKIDSFLNQSRKKSIKDFKKQAVKVLGLVAVLAIAAFLFIIKPIQQKAFANKLVIQANEIVSTDQNLALRLIQEALKITNDSATNSLAQNIYFQNSFYTTILDLNDPENKELEADNRKNPDKNSASLRASAFSNDGKLIAAGLKTGKIVISSDEGEILSLFTTPDSMLITALAFSNDNSKLFVSTYSHVYITTLKGEVLADFNYSSIESNIIKAEFIPEDNLVIALNQMGNFIIFDLNGQFCIEYPLGILFSKERLNNDPEYVLKTKTETFKISDEYEEGDDPTLIVANNSVMASKLRIRNSDESHSCENDYASQKLILDYIYSSEQDSTSTEGNTFNLHLNDIDETYGSVIGVSSNGNHCITQFIPNSDYDKTEEKLELKLFTFRDEVKEELGFYYPIPIYEDVVRLKGHKDIVSSVDFKSDGSRIVTADWSGNIYLWNDWGELLQEFKGHFDVIYEVKFSENEDFILSSSRDGTIRKWAIKENVLKEFHLNKYDVDGDRMIISNMTISPNAKYVVGIDGEYDEKQMVLWDANGKEIWSKKGEFDVQFLKFTSNSKYIYGYYEYALDEMTFWDLKGNSIKTSDYIENAISIKSFELSNNDESVLFGFDDGTISSFNLKNKLETKIESSEEYDVYPRSVTANGKNYFLMNSKDEEHIIATIADDVTEIQKFEYCDDISDDFKFSPDGSYVLTVCGNVLSSWTINGENINTIEFNLDLQNLEISPNGDTINIYDEGYTFYSLDRSLNIMSSLKDFFFITYSQDGQLIIGSDFDDEYIWYDVESDRINKRIPWNDSQTIIGQRKLKVAKDGQHIIVSEGHIIKLIKPINYSEFMETNDFDILSIRERTKFNLD